MIRCLKQKDLHKAITSLVIALNASVAICPLSFAQGHLKAWNTNQREQAERLLSAAVTCLGKSQLSKASTLLIQATGTDPTDPAPFAVLGLTYLRQGKYSEAVDALKKSYQINKNAETLLSAGFAYYLQHDYDAAINAWSKVLERDPKIVEVYGDIGFAYLRKGDFVNADTSFRNLIKARPSSQLAYQGLALLNYLAGNFSAARKAAEHAQSIQSYFPVLLLLAKLDYLQGDAQAGQKRVAAWARAATGKRALSRSMSAVGYPTQHDFRWDPFQIDNFDNGRLLAARAAGAKDKKESNGKGKASDAKKKPKTGKVGSLLTDARHSHDGAPSDYFITRELALLEMANGDYQESADHFHEVLQLCPSCDLDWLHLARDLSLLGKAGEASYAAREFQNKHHSERVAAPFLDLAKGEPTVIPDLSPQPEKTRTDKKEQTDSGF